MEIIIRYNNVYLKNVNLGKNFSNMIADLIVDRLGRVQVFTRSKPTKVLFHTDLEHIPSEILDVISDSLKKEASNRTLTKIKERTESTSHRRTTSASYLT